MRTMRTHRIVTKSAAIAIAMTAAFTLSGCFANPLDQITDKIGSEIAQGGAEKLVEGLTGGDIDVTTGKLPADFPAEVPVIEGTIVTSTKLGIAEGASWQVTISVSDVPAAMQQAREKLLGAGFEETVWTESESIPMGIFSNDTYGIILGGIDDGGDEPIVSYQVMETPAE